MTEDRAWPSGRLPKMSDRESAEGAEAFWLDRVPPLDLSEAIGKGVLRVTSPRGMESLRVLRALGEQSNLRAITECVDGLVALVVDLMARDRDVVLDELVHLMEHGVDAPTLQMVVDEAFVKFVSCWIPTGSNPQHEAVSGAYHYLFLSTAWLPAEHREAFEGAVVAVMEARSSEYEAGLCAHCRGLGVVGVAIEPCWACEGTGRASEV